MLYSGCVPTYQAIYPEPVNIKSIIKPGESVLATTKDGRVHELVVTEITDEAIVSGSNKILFTEIDKLEEMTVTSEENTNKAILSTGAIIIYTGAMGAAAVAGSCCGFTVQPSTPLNLK